jgi:hypothetical protein
MTFLDGFLFALGAFCAVPFFIIIMLGFTYVLVKVWR